MNRNDEQHGGQSDSASNGADFWGGQADWNAAQEPTTEHERFDATAHWAGEADNDASRPAARVRRGLSKLLGSGANPTREHGIIRPNLDTAQIANDVPIGADMFDDFDDDDYAYDDTAGFAGAAATPIAGDADWDA